MNLFLAVSNTEYLASSIFGSHGPGLSLPCFFLFWGPGREPCSGRVSWEALRLWRVVVLRTDLETCLGKSGSMKNAGLVTCGSVLHRQKPWGSVSDNSLPASHPFGLPLHSNLAALLVALGMTWGLLASAVLLVSSHSVRGFSYFVGLPWGPGSLHKPGSAWQFTVLGHLLLYLGLWVGGLAFPSDFTSLAPGPCPGVPIFPASPPWARSSHP